MTWSVLRHSSLLAWPTSVLYFCFYALTVLTLWQHDTISNGWQIANSTCTLLTSWCPGVFVSWLVTWRVLCQSWSPAWRPPGSRDLHGKMPQNSHRHWEKLRVLEPFLQVCSGKRMRVVGNVHERLLFLWECHITRLCFTRFYMGVLNKLTVADTLISSVNVASRAAWPEANRLGWPLDCATHSASQG